MKVAIIGAGTMGRGIAQTLRNVMKLKQYISAILKWNMQSMD